MTTPAIQAKAPAGSLDEAQQALMSLLEPDEQPATPADDGTPPEQQAAQPAEQVPPATEPEGGSEDGGEEPEPEATEPEAAPPAEPTPTVKMHKVRVDGQERDVPESELIESYAFRAHNRQESMKLAEQRRAFEQEQSQQARLYTEKLTAVEAALRALEGDTQPDWDALKQTMPADKWQQMWIDHQRTQEHLAGIRREREAELAKQIEVVRRQEAERFQSEREQLAEAIPVFKDPEKGRALGRALADYAQSLGFTPEEASVTDHRLVVLLHKAKQFDDAQAKKPALTNQIRNPVRSAAPGSATSRRAPDTAAKAKARAAASGKVEDAAAAIEALLG